MACSFRHGAWLTMGNVDLHLIKGRPAVHNDDDLIVSHIALVVSPEGMENLRKRLKAMGVQFRTNLSVPNPSAEGQKNAGRAAQVGKEKLSVWYR